MDFKDFYDGLISSSFMLFLFSFTLIVGALIFKPYLALEPNDRDLIVILSAISMLISVVYFFIALRAKKIYKLEIRNVIKFMKKIGIINIIFTPHLFFLISLMVLSLQLIQIMIALTTLIEGILLLIIYKQAYDLFLKNANKREEEFQKNQKLYFKNEFVKIK